MDPKGLTEPIEEDEDSGEDEDNKDEIVEKSPLGRFFRFNDILGTGAYKVVYRGYDNESGCEVAWNNIKIKNLAKAERKRITEEIKMLQNLGHPNILHFLRAWVKTNRDEVVFITEIVTGGSLKGYLRRIKRPFIKVIKRWCRGILEGLAYLHSQEPPIIHRDLKWDNIFINNSNGDCLIGDLGLSTLWSSFHTTILGTPEYMAPEVFDERYGPKVDIYSFGMCVIEMCTDATPYDECQNPGAVYRKISQGIKPDGYNRIMNDEVKSFIGTCLLSEAQRPMAVDLLQHPFLLIDDKDPATHRPVELQDPALSRIRPHPPPIEAVRLMDPKTLKDVDAQRLENIPLRQVQSDIVHFESDEFFDVKLNLRVFGKNKEISFPFNPNQDTYDAVAQDLVSALELPKSDIRLIADEIQSVLQRTYSYNERSNAAKPPRKASNEQIDLLGDEASPKDDIIVGARARKQKEHK